MFTAMRGGKNVKQNSNFYKWEFTLICANTKEKNQRKQK